MENNKTFFKCICAMWNAINWYLKINRAQPYFFLNLESGYKETITSCQQTTLHTTEQTQNKQQMYIVLIL